MTVKLNIAGAEALKRASEGRDKSSIAFPYTDISDAIAVAQGLLKGGGVPLSRDQLASAMGLAPGGGGFNSKINTARTFGVMETTGGVYRLTDLGFEIADEARQKDAMARAFLNVELYRRVYDEFRGKKLPPRPHGLERAFENFGVAPKQTANARLAFDKSARKAGFFPNGDEERLVVPFGLNPPTPGTGGPLTALGLSEVSLVEEQPSAASQPGASAATAGLHASITGMLSELPPPKSEWNKAEQADWLDALAGLFRVIYKSPNDKGEITVSYAAKPVTSIKPE